MILLENSRVFRREKRALMMIEPPRQLRRARESEIHNRIFITVKHSCFKGPRSLMRHSRVTEKRIRTDPFAIEPRKNRRRRGPVKAFIVEANANLHRPGTTLGRKLHRR